MKKFTFLLTLLVLFSFEMVHAQRGTARSDIVNIRFASPLPRNSEWGRALDRLAADWQRVTNDQVRVFVSHDGREGSELRMLSSLASDSIQVGIFTSGAMNEICPVVINLSIPFLIRNEAELDLVLKDVLPILDTRVKEEFVILAWSKGGWVHVFSREQVLTPADLRRQRLGTGPELKEINTVFRTLGFNLVEVDLTNTGQRLASGAINAIYVIPSAVAPMQLHRSLNHMLDLPIAPILGAIVINRVTWNKISSANQQEILRVTRRMALDFDESMTRTETNAISAMGRDGLTINKPTQAQQNLWQADMRGAMQSLLGPVFDLEIYNRMNRILEQARR